jgi:hypothetical protein
MSQEGGEVLFQLKSRENPTREHRCHRITRAALRSGIKIHRRFSDREAEKVSELGACVLLQPRGRVTR